MVLVEGALNLSLKLLHDLEAAEGIQVKFVEGTLCLELSRLPLLPLKLGEEGVGRRLLQWQWGGTSSCAW